MSGCASCFHLYVCPSIVGVWSYLWASAVAQAIKNLPAMQGPRFDPWIRKIPWRREWQPSLGYASLSCPMLRALLSQILWKQLPSQKISTDREIQGHPWLTCSVFLQLLILIISSSSLPLSLWIQNLQFLWDKSLEMNVSFGCLSHTYCVLQFSLVWIFHQSDLICFLFPQSCWSTDCIISCFHCC